MVYVLCDRAFQKKITIILFKIFMSWLRGIFLFLKEGEDWNKTVTNFINKLV